MSVTRSAAALLVLLTEHPEIADLPLTWQVDGRGELWASGPHRDPATPEMASALAAALGAEHGRDTHPRTEDPFVSHCVYGEFMGLKVNYHGFEYLTEGEAA